MSIGSGGLNVPGGASVPAIAAAFPQISPFTNTPSAVRTSSGETTPLAAVSMPPFAVLQGMPGQQIIVDRGEQFQLFFGAGVNLTPSSAYVIMTYLTPTQRAAFLQKAFGAPAFNSMIRLSMGDQCYCPNILTGNFQTYNDVANDTTMANFSIAKDVPYLIPLLQQILAINPNIRIVASNFSPPAWMKTSGSLINGYYSQTTVNNNALSLYFVKFVQAYASYGIPIWAVTCQNEPNVTAPSPAYPACGWAGADLAAFTAVLGAAFDTYNIRNTKILACDASWGDVDTNVMNSSAGTANALLYSSQLGTASSAQYLDGASFHGYNYGAIAQLHAMRQYTGKSIHMIETSLPNSAGYYTNDQRFAAMMARKALPTILYGSSSFLSLNLALDQNFNPGPGASNAVFPHVFIMNDGSGTITYNAEFYVNAHVNAYLKPGARRCYSTQIGVPSDVSYYNNGGFNGSLSGTGIQNVAFANPDGSTVVVLYNSDSTSHSVTVTDKQSGLSTVVTLASNDAVSMTWSAGAGTGVQATGSFVGPAAPTSLAATNNGGTATLNWTAPADSATAGSVGGYLLMRGTAPGAETTAVQVVPASATSCIDNTVSPSTTYYWTLIAYGLGGYGTASNEATTTVVPLAPSGLTISPAAGNNQIALNMSAQINGSPSTSFSVLRGTTAGGESATPIGTATPSSTTATNGPVTATYVDTTAVNGTAYFYEFVANSTAGNTTSSEVTATPSAIPAHYANITANNQDIYSPSTYDTDITDGFVRVRGWLNMASYVSLPSGGANAFLVSRAPDTGGSGSNAEWIMQIGNTGTLYGIYWDTAGTQHVYQSTATLASVATANVPIWWRITINASTGALNGYAAGTVTFEYSANGTAWTQLGSVVTATQTGINHIGTSAPGFTIGANGSTHGYTAAKIYKVVIENSALTILGNPDFTTQPTSPFFDTAATPVKWIINGPTQV